MAFVSKEICTKRIGPYVVETFVRYELRYWLDVRAWFADPTFTVLSETRLRCRELRRELSFAEAVRHAADEAHDGRISAMNSVHAAVRRKLLANVRETATETAWGHYRKEPLARCFLAYRKTTADQDGALVVREENDESSLATVGPIPCGERAQIGLWIKKHTDRLPIEPLERPHVQSEAPTILHLDGSVTLWSVYMQTWVRAFSFDDEVLASLRADERSLVVGHLQSEHRPA